MKSSSSDRAYSNSNDRDKTVASEHTARSQDRVDKPQEKGVRDMSVLQDRPVTPHP